MLEVQQNPGGWIDLSIAGKIDPTEMRDGLDAFFSATDGQDAIKCLYRIRDVGLPNLVAIAIKLRRLPRLFGVIKRLDKIAVVANQTWVRRMAKIENVVIPRGTIRAFDPIDEPRAIEWLSGT